MLKIAFLKLFKTFRIALPIIFGVLLLISFLNPLLKDFYSIVFTGNYFLDPIVGAIAGSLAFGIPITAYITGGELLTSGVSLLAITAFIMAWTTVGFAMLPLEIKFLGKKLAIARNIANFFIAIIISILTIITLKVFT